VDHRELHGPHLEFGVECLLSRRRPAALVLAVGRQAAQSGRQWQRQRQRQQETEWFSMADGGQSE